MLKQRYFSNLTWPGSCHAIYTEYFILTIDLEDTFTFKMTDFPYNGGLYLPAAISAFEIVTPVVSKGPCMSGRRLATFKVLFPSIMTSAQ